MQFGDGAQTCMVYQADHPPQANCQSVIEALIVGINVHQEKVDSHKVGMSQRGIQRMKDPKDMKRAGPVERECRDLGRC